MKYIYVKHSHIVLKQIQHTFELTLVSLQSTDRDQTNTTLQTKLQRSQYNNITDSKN